MAKKILIIEDEVQLVEVMTYLLKGQYPGCEIHSLNDGWNAIDKISSIKPHIVLLDIIIPGKSGIDILAEMSETGLLSDIPVVMISAQFQNIEKEYCIQLGAKAFLTKPFESNELIDIIDTYVVHSVRD